LIYNPFIIFIKFLAFIVHGKLEKKS
jgi:hypothetical protein